MKDTPHSELLLRIILNHRTSPSGHDIRCQKNESIAIVRPETTQKTNKTYKLVL